MELEGPAKYFKSIWNCPDLFGLTAYWVYVAMCLRNKKEEDFRSAV